MMWFTIALFVFTWIVVIGYACVVIAGEADDELEEMRDAERNA